MCANPNNAAVCIMSVPSLIPSISKSDLAFLMVPNAPTTIGTTFTDVFHSLLISIARSLATFLPLLNLPLSYSQISWDCNVYNPAFSFIFVHHYNVRTSCINNFICLDIEVPENFHLRGSDDCFCQMFIPVVRMR